MGKKCSDCHYPKACRSKSHEKAVFWPSIKCRWKWLWRIIKKDSCQKLESHNISAKIYIDSPAPSNNPQLIILATDTGVSKTLLNRLDWEKVKHLCTLVKTSKRFRPFGTAYHLPIRGKAKVTLCDEKVLLLNPMFMSLMTKGEQLLLGEQDAIYLGIFKLHSQGAPEVASPDKPESEAWVSKRISYPKGSQPPEDSIVSGGETQTEIDANMKKLISQFPALFSATTGKFQGPPIKIQVNSNATPVIHYIMWSNFKAKSLKCARMILLKGLSKLRSQVHISAT